MSTQNTGTLALACIALLGCGAAIDTSRLPNGTAACAGGLRTSPPSSIARWVPTPEGTVTRVEIRGLRTVPEALVQGAIGERVGTELDLEWVRQDLAAILELEAFEDVRASAVPGELPTSVVLTYEVAERPLISGVVVRGSLLEDRTFERPRAGELYEAAAVHRSAQRLAVHHRTRGYDQASARAHAQRVGDRVEVCLEVRPGRQRRIASFEFVGNERVDDELLRAEMAVHGGRVNTVGAAYNADLIVEDAMRWAGLYYDRGMLSVRVHDPETEWDEDGRFHVRVRIEEGTVFRIGRLTVTGDVIGDRASYEALLTLSAGDVFDRSALLESIEAIYALDAERGRGRESVEILPETEMLPAEGIVNVMLELQPLAEEETP